MSRGPHYAQFLSGSHPLAHPDVRSLVQMTVARDHPFGVEYFHEPTASWGAGGAVAIAVADIAPADNHDAGGGGADRGEPIRAQVDPEVGRPFTRPETGPDDGSDGGCPAGRRD